MAGVAMEMEVNKKKNWRSTHMEIEERAISRMLTGFMPCN